MRLFTTLAVPSLDSSFTTRISPISGWLSNDAMHAAMTASSFRAGTIAVTEPEAAARAATPIGGKRWASLVIVYGMRKDPFPMRGNWVSIAFDENRSKNWGLGRDSYRCAGFGALRHAHVPARRSLDSGQDRTGLSFGSLGETRAPHRPEGQGRHTEFLGDLVSAVHRGNAGAQPASEVHRIAQCVSPGCER